MLHFHTEKLVSIILLILPVHIYPINWEQEKWLNWIFKQRKKNSISHWHALPTTIDSSAPNTANQAFMMSVVQPPLFMMSLYGCHPIFRRLIWLKNKLLGLNCHQKTGRWNRPSHRLPQEWSLQLHHIITFHYISCDVSKPLNKICFCPEWVC